MKFAQITLGLPLNQLFDYSIPAHFGNIPIGSRVTVDFARRKLTGFVVGLKDASNIKKVKPIIRLIDQAPLLSPGLLEFTKLLSEYYHSSWGKMIESALPKALRGNKQIDIPYKFSEAYYQNKNKQNNEIFVVLDSENNLRFNFYFEKIEETLKEDKQIIVISPDVSSAAKIKEKINERFKIDACILNRYQKTQESIEQWISIANNNIKIIVGTMSGIFAPCSNLGLIIVDEEDNETYKQDQSPFYRVRDVAMIRSEYEKCALILGSKCLSLESFYLTKKKKAKLIHLKKEKKVNVSIIDMNKEYYRTKKGDILSARLENEINALIKKNERVGVFVNRLGFATTLKCKKCNFILKCPRCDVNLTYNFKIKKAHCRLCNYSADAPSVCPDCKTSYLNYLGVGVEKLDSYLHRIFPRNKESICVLDRKTIKEERCIENIIAVLADILLNMPDFDSAEKTFSLFYRLYSLAENNFYIQTSLPHHYCWQALKNNNPFLFYDKELRLRKELGFPPYWHFAQIILRGKDNNRVKERCFDLFKLLEHKLPKDTFIYPPQPAQPAKLRNNFRWQVLLKVKNVLKINKFLTKNIKNLRFSNIILTVNIDP